MKIVNLTPHAITLRLPDGSDMVLPPSGAVARVAVQNRPAEQRSGIPVPVLPAPVYGEIEGLPDPQPDTAYVVSGLVLSRCIGRNDVYAPATGPADGAIRDEAGRIVAVTKLVAA